ncbi:MAG: hypothetical protein C4299_02810 [Thermoleophilia bacterium]
MGQVTPGLKGSTLRGQLVGEAVRQKVAFAATVEKVEFIGLPAAAGTLGAEWGYTYDDQLRKLLPKARIIEAEPCKVGCCQVDDEDVG